MIKVTHGNVMAAFDFAQDLSKAKSVSDVRELASVYARARYDALAVQTKEPERALAYLRDRDRRANQREVRQWAQGRCVIQRFKDAPKRPWLFGRTRKSVLKILERGALVYRSPNGRCFAVLSRRSNFRTHCEQRGVC